MSSVFASLDVKLAPKWKLQGVSGKGIRSYVVQSTKETGIFYSFSDENCTSPQGVDKRLGVNLLLGVDSQKLRTQFFPLFFFIF